jgi:hypothetical protein
VPWQHKDGCQEASRELFPIFGREGGGRKRKRIHFTASVFAADPSSRLNLCWSCTQTQDKERYKRSVPYPPLSPSHLITALSLKKSESRLVEISHPSREPSFSSAHWMQKHLPFVKNTITTIAALTRRIKTSSVCSTSLDTWTAAASITCNGHLHGFHEHSDEIL